MFFCHFLHLNALQLNSAHFLQSQIHLIRTFISKYPVSLDTLDITTHVKYSYVFMNKSKGDYSVDVQVALLKQKQNKTTCLKSANTLLGL